MSDDTNATLVEQVRTRYAGAARAVLHQRDSGCGCGDSCCGSEAEATAGAEGTSGCCDTSSCCGGQYASSSPAFDSAGCFGGLYAEGETAGLPDDAVQASLGCGNPLAVAELREGERVLDLARANAAKAGAANVEFLQGEIEDLPLPDAAVDVVISNCVINLSADKPAVLAEMFRVLVPGGRIGISDVVAEDHLTAADRAAAGSFVGCIAGALSRAEYRDGLAAAGFTDASVTFTHEAAPGMHSAVIRAVKPASS